MCLFLCLVINPDDVDKEVQRLCSIKLKRHDKINGSNAALIAKKIVKTSFVIEKFLQLPEGEKRMFLSLHDAFEYLENKDRDIFALDIEAIKTLFSKKAFDNISEDIAAKVWGIFNTNCFEHGVYNMLSRVNHSCIPNTEFVWNCEEKTQDLR